MRIYPQCIRDFWEICPSSPTSYSKGEIDEKLQIIQSSVNEAVRDVSLVPEDSSSDIGSQIHVEHINFGNNDLYFKEINNEPIVSSNRWGARDNLQLAPTYTSSTVPAITFMENARATVRWQILTTGGSGLYNFIIPAGSKAIVTDYQGGSEGQLYHLTDTAIQDGATSARIRTTTRYAGTFTITANENDTVVWFARAEGVMPTIVLTNLSHEVKIHKQSLGDDVKELFQNLDEISSLQADVATLEYDLDTHTADSTVHVTSAEKTAWNNKLDASALEPYLLEADANVLFGNRIDVLEQQQANVYTKDDIDNLTTATAAALNDLNKRINAIMELLNQ